MKKRSWDKATGRTTDSLTKQGQQVEGEGKQDKTQGKTRTKPNGNRTTTRKGKANE